MRLTGIAAGLFSVILSACGGGSDNVQTGVFTDSPVMELRYETETQSGLTNYAGEFKYKRGESISFSLGGITLGSTRATSEITPLDLVGANSLDEANEKGLNDRLVNMLVFLQSLDRDHNPENGIDLTDLDEALAGESLDFTLDNAAFRASTFRRIVNEHDGFFQSGKAAQNHFMRHQKLTTAIEVPVSDTLDFNGDGEADTTVTYRYDPAGRIEEVTEARGETIVSRTLLTYNAAGQLASLEYTGLGSGRASFSRHYEYDDVGREISRTTTDTDGAIVSLETRTFDTVGNMISAHIEVSHRYFGPLSPYDLYLHFPNSDGAIAIDSFSSPDRPADTSVAIADASGEPVFNISFVSVLDPDFALLGQVKLIIDTSHHYDEHGNLEQTIITSTNDGESLNFPLPESQATFIYENGKLILLKTVTGNADNPSSTSETHYSYSETGQLMSCEKQTNGQTINAATFDETPNTDILPQDDCKHYFKATTTFDQNDRISKTEGHRIRVGETHEIIYSVMQEFFYEKDLLSEKHSTYTSEDTTQKTVRKYAYSENGSLASHELYVSGILKSRRSREFQNLEVEQLP